MGQEVEVLRVLPGQGVLPGQEALQGAWLVREQAGREVGAEGHNNDYILLPWRQG